VRVPFCSVSDASTAHMHGVGMQEMALGKHPAAEFRRSRTMREAASTLKTRGRLPIAQGEERIFAEGFGGSEASSTSGRLILSTGWTFLKGMQLILLPFATVSWRAV
jgi:hypothetical protein